MQADTIDEFKEYLKAGRDKLSPDEEGDIKTLDPSICRQACFTMDGAMHHKGSNPYYVQRVGSGGLFGADGKGRHSKENGWEHDRCIFRLFLHKFGKKNAKAATAFSEEKTDLTAYADDYEYATWLFNQDILYLRQQIDESEFASDVKFEL